MIIIEEYYNEASSYADKEIDELLDNQEVMDYMNYNFSYYSDLLAKKITQENEAVIDEYLSAIFTQGYIDGVISILTESRTNIISFDKDVFKMPVGKLFNFAHQVALHMYEDDDENYPLANRLDDTAFKQQEGEVYNSVNIRKGNMNKVKNGMYLCGFHCAFLYQRSLFEIDNNEEGLISDHDDNYFLTPEIHAVVDYYNDDFERWTIYLSSVHPSVDSHSASLEQIGAILIHVEDVNQMDTVSATSPMFEGNENRYLRYDRICVDLTLNRLYVNNIDILCHKIMNDIAKRNKIKLEQVNITFHSSDERPKFKTLSN